MSFAISRQQCREAHYPVLGRTSAKIPPKHGLGLLAVSSPVTEFRYLDTCEFVNDELRGTSWKVLHFYLPGAATMLELSIFKPERPELIAHEVTSFLLHHHC